MPVFNETQAEGSNNPSNLDPVTPKVVDNGADTALLQPANQVAFQSVSATPTQAEVEGIRDALVAVGIMKAS